MSKQQNIQLQVSESIKIAISTLDNQITNLQVAEHKMIIELESHKNEMSAESVKDYEKAIEQAEKEQKYLKGLITVMSANI